MLPCSGSGFGAEADFASRSSAWLTAKLTRVRLGESDRLWTRRSVSSTGSQQETRALVRSGPCPDEVGKGLGTTAAAADAMAPDRRPIESPSRYCEDSDNTDPNATDAEHTLDGDRGKHVFCCSLRCIRIP